MLLYFKFQELPQPLTDSRTPHTIRLPYGLRPHTHSTRVRARHVRIDCKGINIDQTKEWLHQVRTTSAPIFRALKLVGQTLLQKAGQLVSQCEIHVLETKKSEAAMAGVQAVWATVKEIDMDDPKIDTSGAIIAINRVIALTPTPVIQESLVIMSKISYTILDALLVFAEIQAAAQAFLCCINLSSWN
jgi:hypothetical protein